MAPGLFNLVHIFIVGPQHGFGYAALGRNAKGRDVSDATLRSTKADPLSGQGMYKENCVRIAKA